jgi:SSS family solute:Na+ symporter
MDLHLIDVAIILLYILGMLAVGFIVERRARVGINKYFLGGNELPWWALSMSNAASMFDISGTMWLVSLLYVYGLKSVFIPWLWPVFNQIFLMVYLSAWLRRSGAVTGAEWITLRFGADAGAEASRISVVIFALVSVVAFIGYAFVGVSKFAAIFLPDTFSPNTYAVIIICITTLYTALGGLYGVVLTDVIQFVIMTVSGFAIGVIAMQRVSAESLAAVVPTGWSDITLSWKLGLNWSNLMPAAQKCILNDGYTMFGAFFMMMTFKGVLVSAAGPAPNYDMQRILAAKNAREASLMSGLVTAVLFVPRYFMVAGITVIALTFLREQSTQANTMDLEKVLPLVIRDFAPVGLAGLLIAGLLSAFMSTFSGTANAAAAYLVNDVYKRYIRPHAKESDYIRASYLSSIAVVMVGCAAGYFIPSVHAATNWIVSALWGGYAAPNILKWHWWRLNGFGYFWGMTSGILGAIVLLAFPQVEPLTAFPILLLVSTVGAVAGSLLTKQQDEETLVNFYSRTRPWGWWFPVTLVAIRRDPLFEANRDFARDMLNVIIGIIWQTAFVALPIYVVIHNWNGAGVCLVIIVTTSAFLKFSWYDRLQIT